MIGKQRLEHQDVIAFDRSAQCHHYSIIVAHPAMPAARRHAGHVTSCYNIAGRSLSTRLCRVPEEQAATTETVYRHQIRPVVLHGAEAMDRIFPEG